MKLSAVRKDGMWGGNVLAGNILRGGKENEGKGKRCGYGRGERLMADALHLRVKQNYNKGKHAVYLFYLVCSDV